MACMAARPAVDGIVEDIQQDFNVLRVDIHTELGIALRERLGFTSTPEFILFNADGEAVWRDHFPPTPEQIALAESR